MDHTILGWALYALAALLWLGGAVLWAWKIHRENTKPYVFHHDKLPISGARKVS